MPFSIVRDDIARVSADVLVNAANERLAPGGGVCGAIFAGAGHEEMGAACARIGRCPTGRSVVTPGFSLPCRWVVHAVGPVWRDGRHGEEALLRSCYQSVFAEVRSLRARSVAFPLISAGIFGYPVRAALDVAREEARAFLDACPDVEVTLVVFSRDVVRVGVELVGELVELVDNAYVARRERSPRERAHDLELSLPPVMGAALPDDAAAPEVAPLAPAPAPAAAPAPPVAAARPDGPFAAAARPRAGREDLAERLAQLDAPFSTALLELIDARGLTDAQVYRRANVSRQLFSKIRSRADYRPSKPTAVALAMALELTLPQTQELLARAGLTLSRSSKFDVIVGFYIERGVFDVLRVNEALFSFDQPLLGSS